MNTHEMQEKAKAATAKAKDSLSKMTDALPPEVKARVSNTHTWIRFVLVVILFTVIALFLFRVLLWATGLLIVVQFLFMLFTGNTNPALNNINRGLARYVGQVWEYLLFCSERFPLPDWVRNLTSSSASEPTQQPAPANTQPAAQSVAPASEWKSSETQGDVPNDPNRSI